jgi:hypothetical protein
MGRERQGLHRATGRVQRKDPRRPSPRPDHKGKGRVPARRPDGPRRVTRSGPPPRPRNCAPRTHFPPQGISRSAFRSGPLPPRTSAGAWTAASAGRGPGRRRRCCRTGPAADDAPVPARQLQGVHVQPGLPAHPTAQDMVAATRPSQSAARGRCLVRRLSRATADAGVPSSKRRLSASASYATTGPCGSPAGRGRADRDDGRCRCRGAATRREFRHRRREWPRNVGPARAAECWLPGLLDRPASRPSRRPPLSRHRQRVHRARRRRPGPTARDRDDRARWAPRLGLHLAVRPGSSGPPRSADGWREHR